MMCLGEQLVRGSHQGVGPSLQDGPATLLDFCCAFSQPGEEGIQFLPRLRCHAKAGVRRHFLTGPVPNRFVGVEVRAVRRQGSETQVEAGHSEVLLIVPRPDQQDYQGTGVTVEVARRLDVPNMKLIVNKVPMAFAPVDVKARVEGAYQAEVAAILPHSEEMMTLASAGVFVTRFPEHPITAILQKVAQGLGA